MTHFFTILIKIFAVIIIVFFISCKDYNSINAVNNFSEVKDSVTLFAQSISKNISAKGPAAWIDIFQNSSNFFMASDGHLDFPDYDSAKTFINIILVKNIKSIKLNWGNLHIEPYTNKVALIAANFNEEIITNSSDQKTMYNGYFTGIAQHTASGWKLHNAHWSLAPSK